jgi:hypothetical protein
MRVAWLAVLTLGVAACGGRESGGSPGASTSSSTGATSGVGAGSSTTSGDGGLPACLVGPVGPGLPIDVYGAECFPGGPPTGECTAGTPACTYCALPSGLCSPTYGPRTFYACACSNGSWSCTVSTQDETVCAGPVDTGEVADAGPVDAGPVDAGPIDANNVTTDGAVCPAGETV